MFAQTFKKAFLGSRKTFHYVQIKLDNFLLADQNEPHETNAQSPVVMLIGHRLRLRSRLDILKPDV